MLRLCCWGLQHAVTFAAGLATEGIVPFAAIYSSFLQRGYDQIVHDVCLQSLPGMHYTSSYYFDSCFAGKLAVCPSLHGGMVVSAPSSVFNLFALSSWQRIQ